MGNVQIPALISLVLALLTLVAVVASAVAVARANLSKATIETLNASNDALSERLNILKDICDETKEQLTKLQAENAVLRNLASGADAIKELTQLLMRTGDYARGEHHDIMAMLTTVAENQTESNALVRDEVKRLNTLLDGVMYGARGKK